MSELRVNKITPRSGTDVQLGDSGDTITVPSGATLDTSSSTVTLPDGSVTNAKLAGSISNDKLAGSITDDKLIAPTRHSIRPSLNLDFANSKVLDPRITFTRGSNATYYDGYTSVKAEENLYLYSEDFTQAGWGKNAITVTADDTTAPDGTTTAERLTVIGTGGAYIYRGGVMQTGKEYTISIYAKAGTGDSIRITNINSGTTGAWFDLSTGTIGTQNGASNTATITDVGNGWYRCTRTFASVTASSSTESLFGVNDADGSTGSVDGEYIYVWGAQLEQRDSVTAYTATTSSPITKYQPALQTAGNNVARFDHNPTTGESLGLLIEEQRTNLVTHSEDLVSSFTVGSSLATILSNTIIAPDGNLTGSKLYNSTTTGEHYREYQFSYSAGSYSFSVYAKAGEYDVIILRPVHVGANEGSTTIIQFTLTGNGSFNITPAYGSCSIDNVGNGWYRCVVNLDLTGTVTTFAHRIQLYDGSTLYTGDGYSGSYIWGAQVEEASFPTSYIKTTGSQVTRSGDEAIVENIDQSEWFKQGQGTLYGEFIINGQKNSSTNPDGYLQLDDGTISNLITFRVGEIIAGSDIYAKNNGSIIADTNSFSITNNQAFKMATSYNRDDLKFTIDSGTSQTDGSFPIPNFTNLEIGDGFGVGTMTGTVKKVSYYPLALTTSEIQDLSEE